MIRTMSHDDLAQVADLAQSERLLHAGRQPRLWAPASSGHHVHPLLLRQLLDRSGAVALVDERDGAVVGAAVATMGAGARVSWVVSEFVVRSSPEWDSSGRALLASLASRAVAAAVDEIAVECATIDAAKARMLASSGLTRTNWLRHRKCEATSAAAATSGSDAGASALPWVWSPTPTPPQCSGRNDVSAGAPIVVGSGSAQAIAAVAGVLRAPAGYEPDGSALVIGPIGFLTHPPGSEALRSLAELLPGLVAERGHRHLLVNCGPADVALDAALEHAGYQEPLSWWRMNVTALGTSAATSATA